MKRKSEITLFESLIIAILLTLILFFISDRVFFAPFLKKLKTMCAQRDYTGKEIKFTFVDLPDETPVKENPNAKLFSDISRKAAGGKGKKSDNPFSKGNVKEVVIKKGSLVKSRKMQTMPQKERIAEKNKSREKGEEKKNNQSLNQEIAKKEGEKQKQALSSMKQPLLNTENLFSVTKPEIYSNEKGGFVMPGNFSIDTQGFDLGPYAKIIQQKVKSNWIVPPIVHKLYLKGTVQVAFSIDKNGNISDLRFLKKTGLDALDMAAFYAIKYSNPFPPLPSFIKDDKIQVKWTFYYYVRMK